MDDLPAGYPDATASLAERMADSTFADTLRGEFLTFLNDYAENRGLLRFHYHRMDELWQGLKDISAECRAYPEGPAGFTEPQGFITEDEISEAACQRQLCGGRQRQNLCFFYRRPYHEGKSGFFETGVRHRRTLSRAV